MSRARLVSHVTTNPTLWRRSSGLKPDVRVLSRRRNHGVFGGHHTPDSKARRIQEFEIKSRKMSTCRKCNSRETLKLGFDSRLDDGAMFAYDKGLSIIAKAAF